MLPVDEVKIDPVEVNDMGRLLPGQQGYEEGLPGGDGRAGLHWPDREW